MSYKEKKQNWYTNPKKYHFIYKTTNLVNEKFYYGMHSTDDIDDGYIGSGTRLWHSIRKHGRENFKIEILEFCLDREALKKREAELINEEVLKDPKCMNMKVGGDGGWSLTEEQFLKRNRFIIELRKMSNNLDITFTKHHWIGANGGTATGKLRKSGQLPWPGTGKLHSEETKKKIGLSNSSKQAGLMNSQFGTCWIYHELVGNKKCKKDLLPEFIEQGWMKRRKK
jgi:hypothetical protein